MPLTMTDLSRKGTPSLAQVAKKVTTRVVNEFATKERALAAEHPARKLTLDELAAVFRADYWSGNVGAWLDADGFARRNWRRVARTARKLLAPKRGRTP